MVSAQGFNALLKLVEEPPPHVKFVFATTEPEKVIATIRSRTHHYPFRLVPPGELQAYLLAICEKEGVTGRPRRASRWWCGPARGSVRDSMSVLDQLMPRAPDEGIDLRVRRRAARLHRRRPARRHGRGVRRRRRGVGVPDRRPGGRGRPRPAPVRRGPARAAARPDHHRRRARRRPGRSSATTRPTSSSGCASRPPTSAPPSCPGPPTSSTLGLTEMRGATAPRLQLELICARVLLPAAEDTDARGARGPARPARAPGSTIAGAPAESARPPAAVRRQPARTPAPAAAAPAAQPLLAAAAGPRRRCSRSRPAAPEPELRRRRPSPEPRDCPAGRRSPRPRRPSRRRPAPSTWYRAADVARGARPGKPGCKRLTWTLLSQNAQVQGVSDGRLTLGVQHAGAAGHASCGRQRPRGLRARGADRGPRRRLEGRRDRRPVRRRRPSAAAAAPPAARAGRGRGAVRAGRGRGRGGRRGGPADRRTAPSRTRRRPTTRTPTTTRSPTTDLLARELGAKVIGEYDAQLAASRRRTAPARRTT